MIPNHVLSLLNDIAILLPAFLLIFSFKGFFQALVANLAGDDTAKRKGYLSLNPLVHVDLVGLTIILVIFFFVGSLLPSAFPRRFLLLLLIALGVRWSIPIPINDRNFKHYKLGGIITTLAGPIASFVLAILGFLALKFLVFDGMPRYLLITLIQLCKATIDLAIWFGIIDLIPLPPFDGGRALKYILPSSQQHVLEWLEEYSIYIIFVLFFFPGISDLFLNRLSIVAMSIKQFMFGLLF